MKKLFKNGFVRLGLVLAIAGGALAYWLMPPVAKVESASSAMASR
ncbi:hypothetical protein [Cohnella cholangitidis]|nr:hypothetical protein [Cohnella cholangitidis]